MPAKTKTPQLPGADIGAIPTPQPTQGPETSSIESATNLVALVAAHMWGDPQMLQQTYANIAAKQHEKEAAATRMSQFERDVAKERFNQTAMAERERAEAQRGLEAGQTVTPLQQAQIDMAKAETEQTKTATTEAKILAPGKLVQQGAQTEAIITGTEATKQQALSEKALRPLKAGELAAGTAKTVAETADLRARGPAEVDLLKARAKSETAQAGLYGAQAEVAEGTNKDWATVFKAMKPSPMAEMAAMAQGKTIDQAEIAQQAADAVAISRAPNWIQELTPTLTKTTKVPGPGGRTTETSTQIPFFPSTEKARLARSYQAIASSLAAGLTPAPTDLHDFRRSLTNIEAQFPDLPDRILDTMALEWLQANLDLTDADGSPMFPGGVTPENLDKASQKIEWFLDSQGAQ